MPAIVLIFILFLGGCAVNTVSDPLADGNSYTFPLNPSLKSVVTGMSQDAVHKLLGPDLLIGYDYTAKEPAPITIPNPYKTEEIKTANGAYTIEYYVASIHHPDDLISNEELVPVIFRNASVAGQGWGYLHGVIAKEQSD